MLESSQMSPDISDTRDIASYLRGFALVIVLACILAEKLNDRLGARLESYVK